MTSKSERLAKKRAAREKWQKVAMTPAEKQKAYRIRKSSKPKEPPVTPEVTAHRAKLIAGMNPENYGGVQFDPYHPLDRLLGYGLITFIEYTAAHELGKVCGRLLRGAEAPALDPRKVQSGGQGEDPERARDLADFDRAKDAVKSACGSEGWTAVMNVVYYRRPVNVEPSGRRRALARLLEALGVLAGGKARRRAA